MFKGALLFLLMTLGHAGKRTLFIFIVIKIEQKSSPQRFKVMQ